jgi:hypothetical protein
MAGPLQALVSYAWAHSTDNGSSDSVLQWVSPSSTAAQDRASSDFDVRHALAAALSCEFRGGRVLSGWAIDGILRSRTGFPVNVLNAEQAVGLSFANAFRPNRVDPEPLWLPDASTPGGRRLNPAAFQATPNLVQGNLGRNAVSGFGMWQADVALRRNFPVREHAALELRIEAFNLTNHPNLADPVPFLASPLFGQPPSMLNLMLGTGSPGSGLAPMFQTGGPRSVQLVVRFRF